MHICMYVCMYVCIPSLLCIGDFLWTVEPLIIIFVGPLIYGASQVHTMYGMQSVLFYTMFCLIARAAICSRLKRVSPSLVKQTSVAGS